jgi:hypothetical protein
MKCGRIKLWKRIHPAPEAELRAKGKIISLPQVGGLHHRYLRAA